jgi:hypothetical protein
MNDSAFSAVFNAVRVLEAYDLTWAIDLFPGRITRPGKDIDFVEYQQ